MITIKNCPVCGGTNQKLFLNCKDHLVSAKVFSISECMTCNFKFTNPRPDDKVLGEYYKSEDYISHTNKNTGLFQKLYQGVRNYTLRGKEKLLRQHVSRGTLLDYGCGTGHFITYCSGLRWDSLGIEPDEGARSIANITIEKAYQDIETLLKNHNNIKFDAITLWHVLEHITDLNTTLDFFKGQMKDNGVLVIAVPNYRSYDAAFYGEYWAAYDVPRHLYHFDKMSVSQLLKNQGFDLIDTKPMYFDSFYVSMLSERNKSGKINYLRAFIIGLISNLKAFRSGNYSSRIYVFKKN